MTKAANWMDENYITKSYGSSFTQVLGKLLSLRGLAFIFRREEEALKESCRINTKHCGIELNDR